MTKTALELLELLSQMPQEPEQNPIAKNAPPVKIKTGKTFKKIKPYWPELPMGRADIEHVSYLLDDWIDWASSSPPPEENNLFKNSVIHTIECALLLWLAPYARKRGFDSEIFMDIAEFSNHCNAHVFQNGYPLEMAEALNTCFSLESPWGLSQEWAKKYALQLIAQLKDIALYHAEVSKFWSDKFSGGKKKGSTSGHTKYVENVVSGHLSDDNKSLWRKLKKHIDDDDKSIDLPLWSNDEKIYKSNCDKEFTFSAFEKQLVKLRNRKKNIQK